MSEIIRKFTRDLEEGRQLNNIDLDVRLTHAGIILNKDVVKNIYNDILKKVG